MQDDVDNVTTRQFMLSRLQDETTFQAQNEGSLFFNCVGDSVMLDSLNCCVLTWLQLNFHIKLVSIVSSLAEKRNCIVCKKPTRITESLECQLFRCAVFDTFLYTRK